MWLKLDDKFGDHPKVIGLTDRQFRVHMLALLYCARHETDGALPAEWVRARCVKADREALITAGLWEPKQNGWRLHDWLDWNRSAEQAKLEREQTRQRVARWRQQRQQPDTGDVTGDDGDT
jgi:hypothetical protein